MLRKLKLKNITWIDSEKLSNEETLKVLKKYDFHELDIEACLEGNQKARIDSYDDYMFMILHFPKYNSRTKSYDLNEFNIFLGKDFLITLRDFPGHHIDKIFENYENYKISKNHDKVKINSGYFLYEMIETMLEKMFKVFDNVERDIKKLEKQVFSQTNSALVKDIMIKKRNIVTLKHMFRPQISVMKLLEFHINKLYAGKMEVYFEDLEDKLEHIVTEINVLQEYIDSLEDAFKTIIDIQTNNVIKILTLFSAFILPLTLITSFYGMNIDLPFQESPLVVYFVLLLSVFSMLIAYKFLKRKWKI